MLRRTLIYAVAALVFLFGMRLGSMLQAHGVRRNSAFPAMPIPADQRAEPTRLAPTLPPSDFPHNPLAQHAYYVAAKIEPLLDQLPCDCENSPKNDRASLLDCFENRKASRSLACQQEAYYAYQESRAGKSAREIRKGILDGAWKNANLSSWKRPLVVKVAADQ